jgi:hypothetical protein
MIGAIVVGLVFIAAGVGCLFWPAGFWRSEVRRYHPTNADEVEPSDRGLMDMQLRGVLCVVVGVVIISSVIWTKW